VVIQGADNQPTFLVLLTFFLPTRCPRYMCEQRVEGFLSMCTSCLVLLLKQTLEHLETLLRALENRAGKGESRFKVRENRNVGEEN
jgi:hypothetical protein